jgi:uncharacterized protein DUF4436
MARRHLPRRHRADDDDIGGDDDPGDPHGGEPADTSNRRRHRWRLILLAGVGILVVYYGLVVGSMRGGAAGPVALDGDRGDRAADRVTLQVETVELDPAGGALDLQLRPVPRGALARDGGAELQRPLELQVTTPGEPPTNFDFGADQIVDPVGASVAVTADPYAFPFDEPRATFGLSARSGDADVPVDVEVVDRTEGWELSGTTQARSDQLQVRLDGRRETLAISFAVLYIGGIVVVAVITLAVIGGAIARGKVDFERIIWLGAMLVAIPAVRNEMPDVPPIGTAVDLFVFLPSVVIVSVALLAASVVIALTEAGDGRPSPEEA